MQVLVNTACLRAFSFCVVIGTNALESFNGSISAMVSKRSDFYVSHVGRAQLALLKRCYPGGYGEVANRLRKDMGLPPLTARAVKDTSVHQRRARQLKSGDTQWTSEAVKVANARKLQAKSSRSTQQTRGGAKLKAANEASLKQREKEGVDEGGSANGSALIGGGAATNSKKGSKRAREDAAPSGLSKYDRGGSNAARNMDESMVQPTKKVRSKGGRARGGCSACRKAGVPVPWLLGENHYRVSSKCEEVQAMWKADSLRGSPTGGSDSTTAPQAAAPTHPSGTRKSAKGKGKVAPAKGGGKRRVGPTKGREKLSNQDARTRRPNSKASATPSGSNQGIPEPVPSEASIRSSGRKRHKPARFLDAAEDTSDSDDGGSQEAREIHSRDESEESDASDASSEGDSVERDD